jgi:hypothetical protein
MFKSMKCLEPYFQLLLKTAHRTGLMVMVWLWLAGWQACDADSGGGVGEYQVKAVCLYNLTQFTDWPPGTFSASNAPIVIGIVGEDPFGQTMDAVVSGEVVRGHPLIVRRLSADDNLEACQVVFICRSEKKRVPEILKRLQGSPVLSVSEINGFAEEGGMVNLLVPEKTVKIEINQGAAEQAGLKISSKLLNLAHLVLNNPHE